MSVREESDLDESPTQQSNDSEIREEYNLWRKNCRYMYEFVSETALTWPSITVQWLPDYKKDSEKEVFESRLLLGTHTSGQDTNYLKLASTQIPFSEKIDKMKTTAENSKNVSTRIKITRKFPNNYEINRARYMYQKPNIVGTINGEGEIDIYDIDAEKLESLAHITPHSANGYGIAWRLHQEGHLLTSSDDKTIALTDVNKALKGDDNSQIFKIEAHTDIINDVKWHNFDNNIFGSVSDDKELLLFDARDTSSPILRSYSPHSDGINTLAFSPFSHNLLAIGNANSHINLLDYRMLGTKEKETSGLLHTMMGHSDSITCLEFSPHNDGILASGAQDRRLILWDLFKIGEEQIQEDAEDGCPELFMMHAGHTGGVTDLSWCPYKNWTLASVADDNIVHLWEVGKSLLDSEADMSLKSTDLE